MISHPNFPVGFLTAGRLDRHAALGLAGSQSTGMGWITETMVEETGRYAYFSLRFYLEDETGGTVDLEWTYEDSDDIEEMWSGFWAIQTIPDG